VSVAEQDAPSKIVEQFSAMLVPIICGLLSATEKLTNSMQNLEFALPALELIQEILKPLKENDQTKYGDNKQNLTQAVENFNEFYIKMTTQL
jgi:hypothetical protein